MSFEILSPWPELIQGLHGTTNNGSIVMRAEVDNVSFLLTGDAEMPVERALIEKDVRNHLDVDVLKVGHHGSKTSTSPEFLNATTPNLAAISVGANNSYGHPTQQVLNLLRSIPIVRTDKSGSIRLTYANQGWLLSCTQKPCISNE